MLAHTLLARIDAFRKNSSRAGVFTVNSPLQVSNIFICLKLGRGLSRVLHAVKTG
jgi:hypothetical protein